MTSSQASLPDADWGHAEALALAKLIRDKAGSCFDMNGDDTREVWEAAKQIVAALTPPAPEPEPWEAIPEGRENAAAMVVNGVVGTYFRDDEDVALVAPLGDVTSVTPLSVLPPDHVAVPRAILLDIANHLDLGTSRGVELVDEVDALLDDAQGGE